MTPQAASQGFVFLDRDGVINVPPSQRYITHWKEFRFLPGVLKALENLHRHGWSVVVVSNQSGVGRGHMSARGLEAITQRMLKSIEQSGGKVRAVYYCTHPPEKGCRCRKPRTGMLEKASRKFPIDFRRSFVIGDAGTDIVMGRTAGCRTILVLTGKHSRVTAKRLAVPPHRIAKDLTQAVRWLLREGKGSR